MASMLGFSENGGNWGELGRTGESRPSSRHCSPLQIMEIHLLWFFKKSQMFG